AFFRKYKDQLVNKTPFGDGATYDAAVGVLGKAGTRLLDVGKTQATPASTTTPAALADARDKRDRISTVLNARYDLLAAAAIQLAGRRGARALVGPLQSRVVHRKAPNADLATIQSVSVQSGPAGTVVVIKGLNLTGGAGTSAVVISL